MIIVLLFTSYSLCHDVIIMRHNPGLLLFSPSPEKKKKKNPQHSDSSLTNVTLGLRLTDCRRKRAQMDQLFCRSHRLAAPVPTWWPFPLKVSAQKKTSWYQSKFQKWQVTRVLLLDWTLTFARGRAFYRRLADAVPHSHPPAASPRPGDHECVSKYWTLSTHPWV